MLGCLIVGVCAVRVGVCMRVGMRAGVCVSSDVCELCELGCVRTGVCELGCV